MDEEDIAVHETYVRVIKVPDVGMLFPWLAFVGKDRDHVIEATGMSAAGAIRRAKRKWNRVQRAVSK